MERDLFVGCDVSKGTFHYCLRNKDAIVDQGELENSRKPIVQWILGLNKVYGLDHMLFCVEHTGIYMTILCRELFKQQAIVCPENPLQIKNSLGMQRGKNDRIDAARIAEYAMRFKDRLRHWAPKRKALQQLDALSVKRRLLVKIRKQLTAMHKESEGFYEKDIQKIIVSASKHSVRGIEKDIELLDKQIEELLKSDESFHRLEQLVTSVPGVGPVTCCELIVRTNEFKDYENAKQLACTAGVAPFEHISGTSIRGKARVSHRAHKELKTLLHLCALTVIARDGEMKNYFDRKVREGKNKMLVINAVRNKLIHRIFAVVRDNVRYQNNYQYKLV